MQRMLLARLPKRPSLPAKSGPKGRNRNEYNNSAKPATEGVGVAALAALIYMPMISKPCLEDTHQKTPKAAKPANHSSPSREADFMPRVTV
jgi:hypothetical protein